MPQYTVRSGDNLWSIAERMLGDGRRFAEIAQLNGISDPSLIQPGQTLEIPYDQPQGGGTSAQTRQTAMAPTRSAVPLPRPNPSRPAPAQPPLPRPNPSRPVPAANVPLPRPDPRRVAMPPTIGRNGLRAAETVPPVIDTPPMVSGFPGALVPVPPPGGYGRTYPAALDSPFAGAPLLPGTRGPEPAINAPPMLPGLAPPAVAMNPAAMPQGETYPSAMAAANARMQLGLAGPRTDAAGRPLEDRAEMMRERMAEMEALQNQGREAFANLEERFTHPNDIDMLRLMVRDGYISPESGLRLLEYYGTVPSIFPPKILPAPSGLMPPMLPGV